MLKMLNFVLHNETHEIRSRKGEEYAGAFASQNGVAMLFVQRNLANRKLSQLIQTMDPHIIIISFRVTIQWKLNQQTTVPYRYILAFLMYLLFQSHAKGNALRIY
jgi:hypothetical protein